MSKLSYPGQALDYCFQFVRNTAFTWLRLKAKYDIRLRFQKMVFEKNINFDGEKFGTADLSLVYRYNRECGGKKSNLVAPRGIEPLFQR